MPHSFYVCFFLNACYSMAVKICLNFYLIESPAVYFVSGVCPPRTHKILLYIYSSSLENHKRMIHRHHPPKQNTIEARKQLSPIPPHSLFYAYDLFILPCYYYLFTFTRKNSSSNSSCP